MRGSYTFHTFLEENRNSIVAQVATKSSIGAASSGTEEVVCLHTGGEIAAARAAIGTATAAPEYFGA
jgi:hypothetical protein